MPLYRYEAADPSGKILRGAMDAPTPQQVQRTLSARGYQSVQILNASAQAADNARNVSAVGAGVGASGTAAGGFSFARGAKPEEMGIFFRQITSLTHSGYSVGAAFGDLAPRTANRSLRAAATTIAQNVTNGASLAGEMARHPNLFAAHVVALVQAGETGGFLEFAFEECALNAEQDAALRQGLWWPRFLTWQSVWSVILLQPMIAFLPVLIAGRFAEYGQSIVRWWVILGLLAHGLWFLLQLVWRQPGLFAMRDQISLRFPVMARLARVRGLAVFTRVLRRLLMSGISVEPAFVGAARAMPNTVLAGRMLGGGVPKLRAGEGVDSAVWASGLMDHDPAQLLVTGQRTGQWIEMLDQVTTLYQEEAARAIEGAKSAQRRAGVLLTILSTGYVTVALTWAITNGSFRFVEQMFPELN